MTLTVDRIITRTAEICGVSAADLTGRSRLRPIASARQLAMWATRRLKPAMSLPAIGARFGLDHTTILYGIRAVDRRMDADVEERERGARIVRELRPEDTRPAVGRLESTDMRLLALALGGHDLAACAAYAMVDYQAAKARLTGLAEAVAATLGRGLLEEQLTSGRRESLVVRLPRREAAPVLALPAPEAVAPRSEPVIQAQVQPIARPEPPAPTKPHRGGWRKTWTEAEVDQVMAWDAEDPRPTREEMARRLGTHPAGSIVAKIRDEKLRRRLLSGGTPAVKKLRPVVSQRAHIVAPPPIVAVRRPNFAIEMTVEEPQAAPADGPRLLTQLRTRQCRFPVGAATGVDQLFCAAGTDGRPYCPDHDLVASQSKLKPTGEYRSERRST